MTVPMSNRTIAERIMDQVIDIDAGPAAVLLQAIHEALDLAEKRGFAKAINISAKYVEKFIDIAAGRTFAKDIRALGLGEK